MRSYICCAPMAPDSARRPAGELGRGPVEAGTNSRPGTRWSVVSRTNRLVQHGGGGGRASRVPNCSCGPAHRVLLPPPPMPRPFAACSCTVHPRSRMAMANPSPPFCHPGEAAAPFGCVPLMPAGADCSNSKSIPATLSSAALAAALAAAVAASLATALPLNGEEPLV